MARKLKSDKILFLATVLLVGLSIVMVYSASAVIMTERQSPYLLLFKQAAWILIGLSLVPIATEVGAGEYVIDFAFPEPSPPTVTTIAWRIGHLLVGVFGDRLARHFGGPPIDYDTYDYPSTAADAMACLDVMYADWIAGVRSLDDADLQAPCGEPGFEQDPMAALILHIHREVLHHGAEISLLRDLYAWQS